MNQKFLNILRPMFIIGLFFGPYYSQAQDFISLHLSARFDTVQENIHAKVTLRIIDLGEGQEFYLNAPKIKVERLLWNGQNYAFKQNDTAIFIQASKVLDTNILEIKYQSHPHKGLHFIGWQDESFRAKRQIWTQGQGIDHRHWIPHYDNQVDKLVFSCDIEFASSYQVMANGRLDSISRKASSNIWHYRMEQPMSSYLIAITIGKYQIKETESASGIALRQYFYSEREEDYQHFYFENEEIFNFLEQEIGIPFPWQNYKQVPVQDFRHGAMENTTATIFGDFFLVDSLAFPDRNYTYVNAHELAHQWFGNLVTASGSKHHWLHEGYATYYQWLSEKKIYGKDYFDWERHKAKQLILASTASGHLPLAHPKAGSERFYQKGAWLLYMLSNKLGRANFKAANQNFLKNYAFGIVDSDSLQQTMEEQCDCLLDNFFESWLYADKEPILKASLEGDSLVIDLDEDLAQALTIRFFSSQKDIYELRFSPRIGHNSIAIPSGADNFAITNASEILCNFKIDKTDQQWREYFADSLPVLEKLRIVEALSTPSRKNRDFLERVSRSESNFEGLRAAALKRILSLKVDEKTKEELLKLALGSERPLLILEAIKLCELNEFPEIFASLRVSCSSYEVRVAAIHKSIDLKDRSANTWLLSPGFKTEPGFPGAKVYLTSLFYRVLIFSDRESLVEIQDYASISFDFLTRMQAVSYLGYFGNTDEETLQPLFTALFNRNWKLSKTAREVLRTLYQKDSTSLEAYKKKKESTWDDFQKKRASLIFTTE
jgi:hypothetical protein